MLLPGYIAVAMAKTMCSIASLSQAHLDDARAAVSFGRGALGTKALAEAIISATPAAYFMSLMRKERVCGYRRG